MITVVYSVEWTHNLFPVEEHTHREFFVDRRQAYEFAEQREKDGFQYVDVYEWERCDRAWG